MTIRPATTDQRPLVYGGVIPTPHTADPDTDGCHRACRNGHTYRWGGCEYAEEPPQTLARWKTFTASDGHLSIGTETLSAEQVAEWLRVQGYTVAARAEPVDVAWPDLLDAAYQERAHLVAYLASLYPDRSVMHPATDVDEPGWGVVYIDTDAGQMSWHIAPSDMDLFEHVPWNPEGAKSPWDGHTTEQKYERLRALTARQRASQGHQEPVSPTPDVGAAQGGEEGSAAESEPRVHYEVEMYNDGWSIPIYRTDSVDDARAHEEPAVTSASTRIVRVTREVIQ